MLKKICFSIITILVISNNVLCETQLDKDSPFLPTWRLLNTDNKQQFISGYQYAWKDAVKIMKIVETYIKQNPKEGAKALESIQTIYDISEMKPDTLVQFINNFYSQPDNNQAPLSKAITAAKNANQ